ARSSDPLHLFRAGRFESGAIEARRRASRWQIKLVQDVLHVSLDGELGDRELLRDLAIPCSARDKREHFPLAGGENDGPFAHAVPFLETVDRRNHQRCEVAGKRRLPAYYSAKRADEPRRR